MNYVGINIIYENNQKQDFDFIQIHANVAIT